jgi:hypothetical protein
MTPVRELTDRFIGLAIEMHRLTGPDVLEFRLSTMAFNLTKGFVRTLSWIGN